MAMTRHCALPGISSFLDEDRCSVAFGPHRPPRRTGGFAQGGHLLPRTREEPFSEGEGGILSARPDDIPLRGIEGAAEARYRLDEVHGGSGCDRRGESGPGFRKRGSGFFLRT